ncbi:cytochrome P450 71D11-like [Mangifera indica]|uniref:cytochrome P450 71D11-like n=1 Tax=Mangifera indica TaxID=29780 RepID=UPI001CF99FF7|nr:cytochrome P450 71D11-like [Mangifera indica]
MELPFPSSILLTFLIFIFMVLKVGKRNKTNSGTLNLPPGPRKLPFIGNLHQLAALGSLPHRGLRQLAEIYGPFMHLQLGEISTIVVSSPEFAEQVMKTHDAVFAYRPYNELANIMSYCYADIIFSPYGEYWRKLRKICTLELLSLKRVQSLQSLREEEMANLINSITAKAGSVMNFTEEVFSSTYGLTARAAFGKKCKDQEKFKAATKEISQLLAGFHIADLFPSIKFLHSISGVKAKMEKLMQECDRILEKIVNEHKMADRNEGDIDLVDVLLKFQENGDPQFSLTTQNVKAVLFDVFSAGSDTSATLMEWAMSELIKNPRVMRKAQAEVREVFNRKGKVDETGMSEMKYLKLVIKETLRLHPAAPLLVPRESREPCEINGFNVPAKTKVMINAWAIARDPKYWMEPESFSPERFSDGLLDYRGTNFEYIPFGAGRRICPGIIYGLANVEFPLASLLYHFDWKLSDGMREEDLEMEERFGVTITRKHDLRVIPILYQPETKMKVADYN